MKAASSQLKLFRTSFIVSFAALALAWVAMGPQQALIVALLAVLEVSLSFDNAVINATILRRMNAFWQQIFLTVGMLIAVVGMRLLFPIVVVSATAGLGLGTVTDLVLHHPAEYAEQLTMAHAAIAAFGGMFLLMIFLDFLLDTTKKVHWLAVIERPLVSVGRLQSVSTVLALGALLVVARFLAGDEAEQVLIAGITGLGTYLAVRGLSGLFEEIGGAATSPDEAVGMLKKRGAAVTVAGRAAFFLFLYLEVLDASFSFDGVVGAFAITTNVLTIALGLGIGALFIRSLTVWLVRHNTLDNYIYLEHGAHYAIGALAVILALSLAFDIPELVTGLVGVSFIGLALASSVMERRRVARS